MSRPRAQQPTFATGAPVLHETESAVLGAALRDPESAAVLSSECVLRDFYSLPHQSLYTAITGLLNDGLVVNPVSVSERSGVSLVDVTDLQASAMGIGPKELMTLTTELQRVSALRVVYNAAVNASSQLNKDSKLEDVMAVLETGLYGVDRGGQKEARDGSDALLDVARDFLKRHSEGGGKYISSGIRRLDNCIIGFRPGRVFVIGGRPSMGKTALVGSLRRNVIAQDYGVIEMNLEMMSDEIAERELAFQSQVSMKKLLTAKDVSEDEVNRVKELLGAGAGDAAGRCANKGRWHIVDRTYDMAGLIRRARILDGRMARQGIKTGLVILDYIQLIESSGADERERSIAGASRACKLLSQQLGCTVMVASQLNRQCDAREDKRPLMSDLRESGAIEQDADQIGFVYREHMYNNACPPEEAELIIRKHRGGPTGTVKLHFNPKTTTFTDPPATVQKVIDGKIVSQPKEEQ
jgi:replicative DNA helicase